MENDGESRSAVKKALEKYVVIPVATLASVLTLSGCDYSKLAEKFGDLFRKTGDVVEETISGIPQKLETLEEKAKKELLYLAPSVDPTLREPLYFEFDGGMPSYVRDELVKEGGFLDIICGKSPRNVVASVGGFLDNKVIINSAGKDSMGHIISKEDIWNSDEVYQVLSGRLKNDEIASSVVRLVLWKDKEDKTNLYIEYDFDKEDGIAPYKVGNSEFDNRATHLKFDNRVYGGEAHRTLRYLIENYK
ncbi:MAG TPA: hypothetical protein PLX15_05710 [Candidatus Woesearchaeota archaeon]|nr:hypothetical protein [Candidatus Woesearchaeota archaeon]